MCRNYIEQRVALNEYFSQYRGHIVQSIRFEYTMPRQIPKEDIMGNIDIAGHKILALTEHGFELNGVNINCYKHDKKNTYVDILFIRDKE